MIKSHFALDINQFDNLFIFIKSQMHTKS